MRLTAAIALLAIAAACEGTTSGRDAAFDAELLQYRRARSSFEATRRLQALRQIDPERARAVLLEATQDERVIVSCSAALVLAEQYPEDAAASEAARVMALDPTTPLFYREAVIWLTRGRGPAWHAEAIELLVRQATETRWPLTYDWQ